MLRSLTPMRSAMVFALAESYLTPPSCGMPFLYAPIAMIRACVSAKAVAEHTENATAQAVRNAAFMKSSLDPRIAAVQREAMNSTAAYCIGGSNPAAIRAAHRAERA